MKPVIPLHLFHNDRPNELWIDSIELQQYAGWKSGFIVEMHDSALAEATFTSAETKAGGQQLKFELLSTTVITIWHTPNARMGWVSSDDIAR